MSQRLPFKNLLAFLPEVEVLEGLRFALARHALVDPIHHWSDVEDAATIDVRVLDREAVLAAISEAAAEAHQEVEHVFAAIGSALASALDGEAGDAAEKLIAAGAEREAAGRYSSALRFFRAAHEAASPLGDRHAQIVSLRRMGRLLIASGEIGQAEACYRRSAEIARDVGETREEVIARTGLGNVYLRVGRWAEAEACYRESLALCERMRPDFDRELGQLHNNLAQVAARMGRVEQANQWLDRAGEIWSTVDSPTDISIYYASRAGIAWEEGRLDDARADYHNALSQTLPDLTRALFEIDLANVYLESGDVTSARRFGRDAERSALAAGSVGYLAEVYRGLGNIERETGGEAVALYEKSLEIARRNGLRRAEGLALVDYARLQLTTGNEEEAVAFLDHAVTMLETLGAAEDARRAREELARYDQRMERDPMMPD